MSPDLQPPQATPGRRVPVWVLVPAVAVLLVAFMCTLPMSENDVYWHILMGQDILTHTRLDGNPIWVYGPSLDGWETTQPAAEVTLWWAWSLAGPVGVMGLRLLLAATAIAVLWGILRAVTAHAPTLPRARAVAVTVLAVIAIVPYWVQERPQFVSFILAPLVGLWMLRLLLVGVWPRWWLVGAVCVPWAWIHGAVLVVPVALTLAAVVRRIVMRRAVFTPRAALVLAVSIAVPVLGTPAGLDYVRHARNIAAAAADFGINEWEPVTTLNPVFLGGMVLMVGWVAAAIRTATRRARVPRMITAEGVLLLLLAAGAVTAVRFLPIWLLLITPLVTRRMAWAWPDASGRRWEWIPRTAGTAVRNVTVAWAILISGVGLAHPGIGFPGKAPTRIWDGATAGTADETRFVFPAWTQAGPLLLLGDGKVRVAIDGRTDRYGPGLLTDYATVYQGLPGWRALWDSHYAATTDAIVEVDAGLADRLTTDLGFTVVCRDAEFVWLTAPGQSRTCPP